MAIEAYNPFISNAFLLFVFVYSLNKRIFV